MTPGVNVTPGESHEPVRQQRTEQQPHTDVRPADFRSDRDTPAFRGADEGNSNIVPVGARLQPVDGVDIELQYPSTKRGRWIAGEPGNGVFQYEPEVDKYGKKTWAGARGLGGVRIAFEGGFIKTKSLPSTFYYLDSADKAEVDLKIVDPDVEITGGKADFDKAEAAMRKKTQNSKWKKPPGYTWHHSGAPGETTLELVKTRYHKAIKHTGSAAVVRKIRTLAARARNASTAVLNSRIVRVGGKTVGIFIILNTMGCAKSGYDGKNPNGWTGVAGSWSAVSADYTFRNEVHKGAVTLFKAVGSVTVPFARTTLSRLRERGVNINEDQPGVVGDVGRDVSIKEDYPAAGHQPYSEGDDWFSRIVKKWIE